LNTLVQPSAPARAAGPDAAARTDHPYLQALARRVLVYDGAMGTTLQRLSLTADDFGGPSLEGCNDHLVLTRPDVITQVHESFLAAGCDVVETGTFQSTPRRLAEWGLRDQAEAINLAAARLARAAADRHASSGQPRFVAGALGPTGMLPSSTDRVLSAISFAELAGEYYQQARALAAGGVDLLLLETMQDMLEVKAALTGFEQLFTELGRRLPIQVQVTLDTSGRMLLGTDVASALTTIEALGVDAVGLNCSTGPDYMREPLRVLSSLTALPIAVIPNAGLPVTSDSGEISYPLGAAAMADTLMEFVSRFGVRIVGGCCGTTPEHIAALVERVRGQSDAAAARPKPGATTEVRTKPDTSAEARLSSAMRAITIRQEPAPLLIGERLNAQGSRKVKRLLLAEDYDALVDVAREQLESGAHVLDVCVATTERSDEADQMARLVKHLSLSVDAPLVIDSTEPSVIDRALEHIPGRALINSVNMENGRRRLDAVLPIARKHGAAVVALCIDEQGMARTREHKLQVARGIHDIAVHEYGLAPGALMFDALTFTLATGDTQWVDSAVETIEGLRLIKRELPGVFTVLGVSNVSFGLTPPARAVLNSVFLYHCVQAGLDAAIVNPAHVRPYAEIPAAERQLADDVVFNRAPDALQRFVTYFEAAAGDAAQPERDDPTAGLTASDKVHWMVVHRRKDGIEAALDAAGVRTEPVRVLNEVLLPAMKEVGDKFGAGELILPFVLQSAEVMQKAVRHLEQFLDRDAGRTKGTVVLATVYGDVHDIGKSLVNTILTNNGYTVIDLGKQAPVNTIVEQAIAAGADAIGLSALLVSTSKQMTECVQELHRRGAHIPVLIGGAAINRRFGRRAWFVDGEQAYAGGVFYCKDAFEGLDTIEALVDPDRRDAFVQRLKDEAAGDVFLRPKPAEASAVTSVRSTTDPRVPVPKPPFYGVRVERDLPLAEIFERLDLNELFRLQWGARGSGPDRESLVVNEFVPRLAAFKATALQEGWLRPQATYGFFPAQSDGNSVVVYDPARFEREHQLAEIGRFAFPRQPGGSRLCIADYFRSVGSGDVDTLALQVVTVGGEATRRFEDLQGRGDYTEAFYLHGLAVETAEATAEWLHRRVRQQLGLVPGQGRRYSWGYPACPDVESHATLFQLLPAATELGMQLTAACQLVPEQSTAAIVVHHPDATYFGIRS
jgi:5-methyltetrahydrofolate--homocysteine methyltransferase